MVLAEMEPAAIEDSAFRPRRFRPLIELGCGGMSRVYLAESLASGLKKLVVLKVLSRDLAADPQMRDAFRREAELSACLNHPNVVYVFEVVEHAGLPIMVMEYLDGVPLTRILSHPQAAMPLRLHLNILTQLLAGLHYFHELRDHNGDLLHAVHRDVSPHNVIVLHEGVAKLLDFGIAKVNATNDNHTRTGVIKGKICYMPPEQLIGQADIYAIGVMMWEAIARRRMWGSLAPDAVLRAIARGDVPRIRDAVPDVPEDLERILERALAANRDDRYDTAAQMQIDLEEATLGSYVQPREIAEFMLRNFGDDRRKRQRTVDEALRNQDATLDGVLAESDHSLRMIGSISRSGIQSGVQPSAAPFRPWYRSSIFPVAGFLMLGAVLGGLWMYTRPAPPALAPAAAKGAPEAKTIDVSIQADAPNTRIYLDGNLLGDSPYKGNLPAAPRAGTLEFRAPGYVTLRRSVQLDQKVDLDVALEPEEAPAKVATQPEANEPERPSRRAARAVAAARPVAPVRFKGTKTAAAAAPSAPAAAPAAPNCNPPYRLGADGVKTFKPECF
jgi:serine/threonine protein kinase